MVAVAASVAKWREFVRADGHPRAAAGLSQDRHAMIAVLAPLAALSAVSEPKTAIMTKGAARCEEAAGQEWNIDPRQRCRCSTLGDLGSQRSPACGLPATPATIVGRGNAGGAITVAAAR
jgi:hypothetical protein